MSQRIRLLSLFGLMLGVILSGCRTGENFTMDTETPVRLESKKSWLYDGPIYETHPYYHGGTFDGITERLPEIADLGVKTLYLMPIWEQPEGFPTAKEQHSRNIYRVPDFYKIDPVYGTPEDLKNLIKAAHENNMKVILDLISNNTPEGSVIWENGWIHTVGLSELQSKAQSAGATLDYSKAGEGEYVTYGCVTREENLLCEVAGLIVADEVRLLHFPRQGWGFAPDYTDQGLIEYFSTLTSYYVREYGIDGWRIDAPGNNWNPKLISGDHSIMEMLKNIKKAITNLDPEAILLCETAHVARESDAPPRVRWNL